MLERAGGEPIPGRSAESRSGSGLTLSTRGLRNCKRNGRTMLTLPRSANGSLRRSARWPPPARTAITSSLRAFRKAAGAHERAALQHERVAAAGRGDKDQHGRQAASHRAAAAAATQRAERARSLLSDEERNDMRGSDADQALNWPVILAARGIGDLLPPEP